jgi:hypothetical protein
MCDYNSFKKWITELETCGYMKRVKDKQKVTYWPFENYLEPRQDSASHRGRKLPPTEAGFCLETNRKNKVQRNKVAPAPQNVWLDGAPPKSDPEAAAKALSDMQAFKDTLKEDAVPYRASCG